MKHLAVPSLLLLAVAFSASCDRSSPQPRPQAASSPKPPAAPAAPAPVAAEATPETVAAPTSVSGRDMRLDKNVVVVIDGSGSMEGKPINEAKKSFAAIAGKLEGWNSSIVAFDRTGTSTRLPLGVHKTSEIVACANAIRTGGSTPLGSAMSQALKALQAREQVQQGYGTYLMLVVTDGAADEGKETALMEECATKTVGEGYGLDVVGYRIAGGHALKRQAHNYREAGNSEDLARAISEALAEADASNDPSGKFIPIAYPNE